VSLVLTLVVLSLAAAVVLWGLSLFLQGYLYNEPADKLPLRAGVGGLAVGCFLTFWVYVNTRADRENKYAALHEFSPEARTDVGGFTAELKVRGGDGSAATKTVEYKRPPGEKGQRYLDPDGKPFRLNTADYITSALVVTESQPAPARFDAVLRADGWTYDGEKKTFRETGGKRYVEGDEPGMIVAPSGGAQFAAIALNLLLFVVLFAVFWPVLRFDLGHAIGLAAVFGLVVMLVLMPLLFSLNKRLPPPPQPTAVTSPPG
jgi:hypothetical protein